MPFIFNEDMALKNKLQGLSVIDANAPQGREVKVRFRLPEDELATMTYPCIIIEHLPLSFAPERQSRAEFFQLPYAPEGLPIWWDQNATSFDPNGSPYYSYFPIAVNLDYRITIYCRKMSEHLQPLLTALAMQPYLPFQFGFLKVPQDGTIRNMFLMEGPVIEYGKDGDGKRLFRASYMVRVMSEVIPEIFNAQMNALVTQIDLDLSVYEDFENLTTEQMASTALISTGPTVAFGVGYEPAPVSGEVALQAVPKVYRRSAARAVWR